MYAIDWMARARRQLAKVRDRESRMRIFDAVEALSAFPRVSGLEALRHHRFGYRLRVGRHRVLLDIDTALRVITIQEVRKRDERTY